MAIEIVDFPIKDGGSFHGKMLVHQRVMVINTIENGGFIGFEWDWSSGNLT